MLILWPFIPKYDNSLTFKQLGSKSLIWHNTLTLGSNDKDWDYQCVHVSGINGIIECNMSCECSLGNKLDTRPSTEQIASSMLYHGSNWHCGMKNVWLVRLAKEPEVITYFKASLGWLRVFKSCPCTCSLIKMPLLFQNLPHFNTRSTEYKCLGYCESALNLQIAKLIHNKHILL